MSKPCRKHVFKEKRRAPLIRSHIQAACGKEDTGIQKSTGRGHHGSSVWNLRIVGKGDKAPFGGWIIQSSWSSSGAVVPKQVHCWAQVMRSDSDSDHFSVIERGKHSHGAEEVRA